MKTNSRQPKRLTEAKTSRIAQRKGDSRAASCSDVAPAAQLLKSDDEKYSPNLKAWLKKILTRYSVPPELVVVKSDIGDLFIGYWYDGSFIGSMLGTVTGQGAKAETGSWVRSSNWKEVKNFWTRYLKIGVCAIDAKHCWYEKRWKQIRKTLRVCRYCGETQKLVKKSEVVKTESWKTTKRVTAHRT